MTTHGCTGYVVSRTMPSVSFACATISGIDETDIQVAFDAKFADSEYRLTFTVCDDSRARRMYTRSYLTVFGR